VNVTKARGLGLQIF